MNGLSLGDVVVLIAALAALAVVGLVILGV